MASAHRLWWRRCGTSLLCTVLFTIFSDSIQVIDGRYSFILLPYDELCGLQELLAAWNVSTPDVESNLAGWSTFDPNDPSFPNISTSLTPFQALNNINPTVYKDPCYFDTWTGLLCYMNYREGSNYTFWDAAVVGLTLEDASIAGTLPPVIWDFNWLTSLTLTGNPNLTGPIPTVTYNYSHWPLNIVDLHSNGLNGSIPSSIGNLEDVKELDLSYNQLIGELPVSLCNMARLKILKLSKNQLTFSRNRFICWPNLVTVDLSNNNFQELLPSFTSNGALHTLNLSHNSFSGEININNFNANASKYLTTFDISDNNLTGSMPNLSNWTSLKALNLSNNNFSNGEFPTWIENLNKSLEIISLRNTSLYGEIDLSMFKFFSNLKSVELDDNGISGIVNFSSLFDNSTSNNMSRLQSISLKNNNIIDVEFDSEAWTGFLNLMGNPYCISSPATNRKTWLCLCYQFCNLNISDEEGRTSKKIIIASSISGGFVVIILAIFVVYFLKTRRERQYLLLAVNQKFAEYDLKPTLFGLNDLQRATKDFNESMKLGEGAFGAVYKGYLPDGSTIAVKQLLNIAKQNMDEFLNEVVLLTSVKHRNLVKLKGCCFSGNRRLLVYEYVENYDLADIMFDHQGDQILNWSMRFEISMGVAQGLHYLHTLVEPKIIHRDIKASNILIDKNMQPKIADFGLALLYPNETTHITLVQIAGTRGYMAPEYERLGQVSEKIDVYSYGVLLLEIVSGRRNIDVNAPVDKAYLPQWAWELFESDNLMDLVDPTIALQMEEVSEVQQVMKVALCCLQNSPDRRPTMAQVVAMLHRDMEVGSIPNHSHHHAPSLFTTSDAIGLPTADSESQALYKGPSSSSYTKGTQELELSAIGAR